MMRPKRTFVKCFVVHNSLHYIIGWATRRSACLGQNLDLQAQGHVLLALGAAALEEVALVGLIVRADSAECQPFADSAADAGVGALDVDGAAVVLAELVVIAADTDVDDIASQAGSDIKALGDIAILRLVLDQSVRAGGGAGQRHALTDLDQGWIAFAGLYLLHTAAAAVGAAADDAHLILTMNFPAAAFNFDVADTGGAIDGIAAVILLAAVAGIDADQQAFGFGVQLAEQGAQFGNLGR